MEPNKHLDGKGEFIYDFNYDILTFKIKDRKYKHSIEFQNFTVDIDDEGFATGIRVFDASKVFSMDKLVLKHIVSGNFKSQIENGVITITLTFLGVRRNKLMPLLTEKENYTQQITTPVLENYHLEDSSVDGLMEA